MKSPWIVIPILVVLVVSCCMLPGCASRSDTGTASPTGSPVQGTAAPVASKTTIPAPVCPAGQVNCGGTCTDLNTDFYHCGSCEVMCSNRFTCDMGECVLLQCPEGFTVCDSRCVDLQTDPRYCGRCGKSCPADYACTKGECWPKK